MGTFDEDELNSKFEKLTNTIDKYICDTTRVVYANEFDLMQLDMRDFDKNIYFISHPYIECGKVYEIIDKDLKLWCLDFCYRNPDRVFQGEK